mmetsp:Transcript_43319/g.69738  ORF Transcript_43319/g.69738 Transcript_43319/m.69738 type:complete len:179 (+) Transcript_43319:1311-1847(+)
MHVACAGARALLHAHGNVPVIADKNCDACVCVCVAVVLFSSIKYFDLVIVIAAGRYTETDLTLMKEMTRNNVPFFAVRTKIDLEIENAEWDMGLSPEETKQVIREDLRANTGLPDDRIFLVSSREPDAHDFPKLKRHMNLMLQAGLENKVNRALGRKLSTRRYFNTLVNNDEFVHADA